MIWTFNSIESEQNEQNNTGKLRDCEIGHFRKKRVSSAACAFRKSKQIASALWFESACIVGANCDKAQLQHLNSGNFPLISSSQNHEISKYL